MKKILSIGYVIIVLAFIYIPILLLVIYSFNEGKNIGVWVGFSFRWYERLDTV